MHLINDELEAFKKRYATLENQNASLRSQLQQVQTQVANCHCIKAKDSVSKYSKRMFMNLMKFFFRVSIFKSLNISKLQQVKTQVANSKTVVVKVA